MQIHGLPPTLPCPCGPVNSTLGELPLPGLFKTLFEQHDADGTSL